MKQLKVFILALLLPAVLLPACTDNIEPPEELLDQKTMVEVMVEIHIAESKINEMRGGQEKKNLLFDAYEKEIFVKNGIDSTTYRQSYDFYMNDLETMTDIYEQVVDSLNQLQIDVNQDK